jgi:CelD/BcsL family acetyltransferase involved in cellulose biosynthesis
MAAIEQLTDQARPAPAAARVDRRLPPASEMAPRGAVEAAAAITTLTTVEEVEALRHAWLALCGDTVETDPAHFLWALRHEPGVVRPHVLAIEGDAGPETLVVGRIADVPLPCKLGRRTVYSPTVRALCVPRAGVLGRIDSEAAARIADELRAALRRGDADVILLRQLGHGSVLHRALADRAPVAARRQHEARTNLRWQIVLPPTRAAYLASLSPSMRKGARRTALRLEQQLGERLSIVVYGGASEVEACLDDVERVAARTYQRRLGVGYLGDARQRARLTMLARRGWFRAAVLYLDAQPVAFELGEVYGGRFHSLAGAYDPAFGSLRVGAHLLMETIGALADDPAVSVFDFGLGDAPYKQKLGHHAVAEGDFVLYARRLRPLAISFARTALLDLSRLVRRGLERLALLERIRRRTRRAPAAPKSPQTAWDAHDGTRAEPDAARLPEACRTVTFRSF